MKPLDRGAILAALDLAPESVEVPEWGGMVFVRGMSGSERDEFEGATVKGQETKDLRARLCAAAICDEDGGLLFGPADLEGLGDKSSAALDRVFTVAARLSGMTRENVADLEKKLSAAHGSDSS